MKSIFAALLLLLQLQPLLGTAACLGFLDPTSSEECVMPEHGAPPASSVGETEWPAPNCALASVCAPRPLTVVSLPENPEPLSAPHSESLLETPSTLYGIPSIPPFHPPRA
jgi:hypothetical protein